MNAYDINIRIARRGSGCLSFRWSTSTSSARVARSCRDDNVKVTAALVHHPPVVPAFAYRFDAVDRSIVISGDTAPSDNLVARSGRRRLVHEALYVPGLDRLVARVPTRRPSSKASCPTTRPRRTPGAWRKRQASRCSCSRHLVPPDDQAITDQMWIDAARVHFRGPVIVGKDLLEILRANYFAVTPPPGPLSAWLISLGGPLGAGESNPVSHRCCHEAEFRARWTSTLGPLDFSKSLHRALDDLLDGRVGPIRSSQGEDIMSRRARYGAPAGAPRRRCAEHNHDVYGQGAG